MIGAVGRGWLPGRRRRGSIYLMMLGASLLVLVIGLAAVIGARDQHRDSEGVIAAAKARIMAESGVEVALERINADAAWRTTYTSGVWTPAETIGDATLSLRFVDEGDADLADNDTDPVRIFARAIVADAVRIDSAVAAIPPSPPAPNLVANGGIESGVSPWAASGPAQLSQSSSSPHSGSSCLAVRNRGSYLGGASQNVTSGISLGKTYSVEAWVRVLGVSSPIKVLLFVQPSSGGMRTSSVSIASVAGQWVRVAGTLDPGSGGSIIWAFLKIRTDSDTRNFDVDDVRLVEGPLAASSMGFVPGTWRRDLAP